MLTAEEDIDMSFQDITSRQFKILSTSFDKIGMTMSQRHNAIYDSTDILRVLLEACKRKKSVGTTIDDLKDDPNIRTPNADLMFATLKSPEPESVQVWFDRYLGKTIRDCKKAGMLSQLDAFAIDLTDVPYYGDGMEEYVHKSRPRNGTSDFVSYIGAHGVSQDSKIMLATEILTAETKLSDLLKKLRTKVAKLRPHEVALMQLLDRGFFNVDCIHVSC